MDEIMADGKENVPTMNVAEKKRFFTTPVAKLNRSIVRGGGNRRNGVSKNNSSNVNANSSIMYKQTLRANNKNLARALDLSKQDTAALARKVLDLEQQKQEQAAKISVLRRLTDTSSDAVELEIERRMKLRVDRFKIKLESAANLLHMVGDELHDVIVMCDHQKFKDIDEIVKDQLELTQMCTPDHFSAHVGKKRSVYPHSNSTRPDSVDATGLNLEELALLTALDDDTESRLSIVSEAAESKRKSSLRRDCLGPEELSRLSQEFSEAPASTITRSKRRTLRSSQRLSSNKAPSGDQEDEQAAPPSGTDDQSTEDMEAPVARRSYTVSRSKRRKADKSDNGVKLLEPLISAAVLAPADSSPSAADEVLPQRLTPGPVIHSPVAPCRQTTPVISVTTPVTADVMELTPADDNEMTTPDQPDTTSDNKTVTAKVIPYDEIPVGSKAALEEAKKMLAASTEAAVSRSRRQTRIIKHSSTLDEDTDALLSDAAGKFFIQISPPKIFNDHKAAADEDIPSPTRTRRTSRRGTYCVKDHTADMVSNENDSLLVPDSSFSEAEDDEANIMDDSAPVADESTVLELGDGSLNVSNNADDSDPDYCPEEPQETDSPVPAAAEAAAEAAPEEKVKVEETEQPPVRQMEIQCKAGQVKVMVGSRDGGPARTKGRKKKETMVSTAKVQSSHFDFESTPPAKPEKDPFDLSMSDTMHMDFATLKEYVENQKKQGNKDPKAPEKKADTKSKAAKGGKKGKTKKDTKHDTESSAAELSESEPVKASTRKGRKTVTVRKQAEPEVKTDETADDSVTQAEPPPANKGQKVVLVDQPEAPCIADDSTTEVIVTKKNKRTTKQLISSPENEIEAASGEDVVVSHPAVSADPSSEAEPHTQEKSRKKRKVKTKSTKKTTSSVPEAVSTEPDSDLESVTSEYSEPGAKKRKRTTKAKPKAKASKSAKATKQTNEDKVKQIEQTVDITPEEADSRHPDIHASTSSEHKTELEEATPVQINKRRGRTTLRHDTPPVIYATPGGDEDKTLTPDKADVSAISAVSTATEDAEIDDVKGNEEVLEDVEKEVAGHDSSPPRRARRAAAKICFKEPSLGGKLRRGDPGTSTLYGDVDIYANPKDKKYKKKS